MSWDKEQYEYAKALTLNNLRNRHFLDKSSDPVTWAMKSLSMISICLENEDYEGARGTNDAIIQYVNEFLPAEKRIKEGSILKLQPNE